MVFMRRPWDDQVIACTELLTRGKFGAALARPVLIEQTVGTAADRNRSDPPSENQGITRQT
jgi:hypothetical protein